MARAGPRGVAAKHLLARGVRGHPGVLEREQRAEQAAPDPGFGPPPGGGSPLPQEASTSAAAAPPSASRRVMEDAIGRRLAFSA